MVEASYLHLRGALTTGIHRLDARIYYADTDFSGVVYHARYLEFFERGRIEYFRHASERYADFLTGLDRTLIWIVRKLEMQFHRPAHVDDVITINTQAADIRGASVRMAQTIQRSCELLVKANFECGLVDSYGRPQRMPKVWRKLLASGSEN